MPFTLSGLLLVHASSKRLTPRFYSGLLSIHIPMSILESRSHSALFLRIGVVFNSLIYDDAVAPAAGVKDILTLAGFPNIDVAFVESIVTRATVSRLSSLTPSLTGF